MVHCSKLQHRCMHLPHSSNTASFNIAACTCSIVQHSKLQHHCMNAFSSAHTAPPSWKQAGTSILMLGGSARPSTTTARHGNQAPAHHTKPKCTYRPQTLFTRLGDEDPTLQLLVPDHFLVRQLLQRGNSEKVWLLWTGTQAKDMLASLYKGTLETEHHGIPITATSCVQLPLRPTSKHLNSSGATHAKDVSEVWVKEGRCLQWRTGVCGNSAIGTRRNPEDTEQGRLHQHSLQPQLPISKRATLPTPKVSCKALCCFLRSIRTNKQSAAAHKQPE